MNFITIKYISLINEAIAEDIVLNIDHIVWFSVDELLIKTTEGLMYTDTKGMNKLLDYIYKWDDMDKPDSVKCKQ